MQRFWGNLKSWVRNKLKHHLELILIALLVLAIVAIAILALCIYLKDSAVYTLDFWVKGETEDVRNLVWSLATIIAGFGAFYALLLRARNIDLAEQGQVTERFTRAVEQLGKDDAAVRMGGLYGLERIIQDSEKDRAAALKTIAAFVRNRAPWNPDLGQKAAQPLKGQSKQKDRSEQIDVETAVHILTRQTNPEERKKRPIDLRLTDLRGLDFRDANLSWADLFGANLSNANLTETNLSGANLSGANLREATISRADLSEAKLLSADLSGANLSRTELTWMDLSVSSSHNLDLVIPKAGSSGANLSRANLLEANLSKTNLSGANLSRAILIATNLSEANFSETILSGADLSGADLLKVHEWKFGRVTQEQVDQIRYQRNGPPQLPEGLTLPPGGAYDPEDDDL